MILSQIGRCKEYAWYEEGAGTQLSWQKAELGIPMSHAVTWHGAAIRETCTYCSHTNNTDNLRQILTRSLYQGVVIDTSSTSCIHSTDTCTHLHILTQTCTYEHSVHATYRQIPSNTYTYYMIPSKYLQIPTALCAGIMSLFCAGILSLSCRHCMYV